MRLNEYLEFGDEDDDGDGPYQQVADRLGGLASKHGFESDQLDEYVASLSEDPFQFEIATKMLSDFREVFSGIPNKK